MLGEVIGSVFASETALECWRIFVGNDQIRCYASSNTTSFWEKPDLSCERGWCYMVDPVHCPDSWFGLDRSGPGISALTGQRLWIQLAVGPQPLRLRSHNSGLAHRIMVKRLATSPHDPLGITDSTCKNQLVVVSVQYGPFNPYIPIRSTTIGKSRVAIDPIAMHTSWRSNSDIASVTSIGYPRMSASGESLTTMHRLLHASGSHPIPTPNDPKTNQYNQDLGLIHSTNGNHLESPNEGSSIDHQVAMRRRLDDVLRDAMQCRLVFQIWIARVRVLVSVLDATSFG
ncbi:dentin sialophosphoprotein-like [Dorcoceras hygrometricum]|uniref:Dentin sialophosphoprotein-like n=1 Tax=Dorcoceras hygrometricum TaxID=472368 RepID=A0A2Z7B8F9_9LAMI|nr:dentin sialophosphoprotein-like [Dorcoceras hygrometricum]